MQTDANRTQTAYLTMRGSSGSSSLTWMGVRTQNQRQRRSSFSTAVRDTKASSQGVFKPQNLLLSILVFFAIALSYSRFSPHPSLGGDLKQPVSVAETRQNIVVSVLTPRWGGDLKQPVSVAETRQNIVVSVLTPRWGGI